MIGGGNVFATLLRPDHRVGEGHLRPGRPRGRVGRLVRAPPTSPGWSAREWCREMWFTCNRLSAQTACDWGWSTRWFRTTSSMPNAILAAGIMMSPTALAIAKRCSMPIPRISRHRLRRHRRRDHHQTEGHQQGVRAFNERRKPDFKKFAAYGVRDVIGEKPRSKSISRAGIGRTDPVRARSGRRPAGPHRHDRPVNVFSPAHRCARSATWIGSIARKPSAVADVGQLSGRAGSLMVRGFCVAASATTSRCSTCADDLEIVRAASGKRQTLGGGRQWSCAGRRGWRLPAGIASSPTAQDPVGRAGDPPGAAAGRRRDTAPAAAGRMVELAPSGRSMGPGGGSAPGHLREAVPAASLLEERARIARAQIGQPYDAARRELFSHLAQADVPAYSRDVARARKRCGRIPADVLDHHPAYGAIVDAVLQGVLLAARRPIPSRCCRVPAPTLTRSPGRMVRTLFLERLRAAQRRAGAARCNRPRSRSVIEPRQRGLEQGHCKHRTSTPRPSGPARAHTLMLTRRAASLRTPRRPQRLLRRRRRQRTGWLPSSRRQWAGHRAAGTDEGVGDTVRLRCGSAPCPGIGWHREPAGETGGP